MVDLSNFTFMERYPKEMYLALNVPINYINECGDTYIDYRLCLRKNGYLYNNVDSKNSTPRKYIDLCNHDRHNLDVCQSYQNKRVNFEYLGYAFNNNKKLAKELKLSPTYEKLFKNELSF